MAQLTPKELNKLLQDAQQMVRIGTIMGTVALPFAIGGFFVQVNPSLDPGRFAGLYTTVYGTQIIGALALGRAIGMIQKGLEEIRIATNVTKARGWNLKGIPLHTKIEIR
ncbi:MAG: hypothetical protein HYU49_01865 [Candidatus Levybacteria bacterium]|nr:hypothetical protein [Candidatus Levybacteria bacterium]